MTIKFNDVFGHVPILGMIHLAGEDPVARALSEISVFEEEGIDGAIVENYHADTSTVIKTLEEISRRGTKLVLGVNILPNEASQAFKLARDCGAKFIQLDHVAGRYTEGTLDASSYFKLRQSFPDVLVLGGVWPKYYHPISGSHLELDISSGMRRADAIVITGEGTGKETPLDKIKKFRAMSDSYKFIVGAGVTSENAYEQLLLADGAIVGSSLKIDSKTHNEIDRMKVRELVGVVKEARARKI